jgi:hypothetical protein
MQEGKFSGLNDPYKHAPPKPDGDPWAILLKPELEADKIRCDAWKEEVQNLLIFVRFVSPSFVHIRSYILTRFERRVFSLLLLQLSSSSRTSFFSQAQTTLSSAYSLRL